MDEYVTKEQVKEEILSWARCINKPENLVAEDTMYVIDALPAADVRPVVHGHWKVTPIYIKCSECGECYLLIPQNFCPNCGADMRGDEDG